MLEAQNLLESNQRVGAQQMLIHIGDGSANQSFLPVTEAVSYTNGGEIIDFNGYHTETYNKDFQSNTLRYLNTRF